MNYDNTDSLVILEGPVVKMKGAVGSHTEHIAVVIKTSEGNFKLRRQGGNPFNDPVLNKYVGKTWSCEGTLLSGSQFLISRCTRIED